MKLKKIVKRAFQYIVRGIPTYMITANISTITPGGLLKNKHIIVTGGGRGLGFYIAKRVIEEGAYVLITGRSEKTLIEAKKRLGYKCEYLVFDIRDIDKMQTFIKIASEKFEGKKIDCLVSNAGISLHEESFRDVTKEGWDQQMETNLKGNFFLVADFIKYLESQSDKSGNIIVISSERGKRADDIPYGLSKVATSSFVQGIATKVISEGIRVNGVAPGVTASDMTGYQRDGNLFAEHQPSKRVFMPEEVAEVVTFLLCDASNCISGEIITCDQGRYIAHW